MNAIFSTRICITSNYLFAKLQFFLQLVALFIENLAFCYYFSSFLINLLHIYALFINKSPQNDKFKEKNKEKQKIVRKEKEKAKNIWSIPLYLLLLHVI